MADDLGQSLSTIRERYQKPLVDALLEIQETQMRDVKSAQFVRSLECLYLPDPNPGTGKPGSAYSEYTFKRKRINAFDEPKYVALSYTWDSPPHLKETKGKYWVESRNNGNVMQSRVRDSVFDRVKKYMTSSKVDYLWIDRECIVQEDGQEKEMAVQAMDLVYHCSEHPIGLLYQPAITSIEVLDLLAGLMEKRFVQSVQHGQDEKKFELTSGLSPETKRKILELLEAIVSDLWWTRAWTYQENYRGGKEMRLLIPHTIAPTDYCAHYVELFGDVPGEIILNSTEFHEAATAFCLAFEPATQAMGLIKARELILERARRYRLLLRERGRFGLDLARKSMTPSIIVDIEKRGLKNPFDRLPIIANCCQYSVRLDGTKLVEKGHSVSLAILALFLLNGEILHNGSGRGVDDRNSGAGSITDFLNAQAFDRYLPPNSAHGLTYNKSCRLIDAKFTEYGIQTKGHLWVLGPPIYTSKYSRGPPFPRDENSRVQYVLTLLANEVKGHYNLHTGIRKQLESTRGSSPRDSFVKEYQFHAALELARAVRSGKPLRPGALWNPSGKSPYRGIFVCDQSELDRLPKFVFTATREKANTNFGYLPNDLDKNVSLAVDVEVLDGQPPRLRTRRWIHNLCYYYRQSKIDVIFPWPRAIEQI